ACSTDGEAIAPTSACALIIYLTAGARRTRRTLPRLFPPCTSEPVRYIVVGRSMEGDMSHGVHAVQHEVEHHIEHEEHGHGGGRKKWLAESFNKKIALLISVLALFLAFAETLGKSSQTEGISLNIKASHTWNLSQPKTIRQTTLRTAAQAVTVEAGVIADEARKAALLKQADDWMKTV